MTPDLVVDASALIEVVAVQPPDPALVGRLITAAAAAPELIDAEVLSVLRKLALRGELTDAEAEVAMRRAHEAPIVRAPHRPLVARAWSLRHCVSAYDALYVALAEDLDVPLVTCDRRLASTSGHRAKIELYAAP